MNNFSELLLCFFCACNILESDFLLGVIGKNNTWARLTKTESLHARTFYLARKEPENDKDNDERKKKWSNLEEPIAGTAFICDREGHRCKLCRRHTIARNSFSKSSVLFFAHFTLSTVGLGSSYFIAANGDTCKRKEALRNFWCGVSGVSGGNS